MKNYTEWPNFDTLVLGAMIVCNSSMFLGLLDQLRIVNSIVAKFTRKETRTKLEINIVNARKACTKFPRLRPLLINHTHFWAIVHYHAH